MTEDLLTKEKEFRRLNKELEQRRKDLMKEIDLVIRSNGTPIPTSGTNGTNTLYLDVLPKYGIKKPVEENETNSADIKGHTAVKSIVSLSRTISQSSLFPQETQENRDADLQKEKRENSSSANKAMVNFLKAKVDMLQNELNTIRSEYKKKSDQCRQLEVEHKKFDDQRTKFHGQMESLKENITKLENSNSDLQSQAQALRTENSTLKKDLENLERKTKLLHQESNNYEMRLNRSVEENEKLKGCLKFANLEEKELRSQIRSLQEENRIAVKNLEKRRAELLNAFKKQALLVDNLQKQNAYLTAVQQIQLTEEDFSRLLDRKLEKLQ